MLTVLSIIPINIIAGFGTATSEMSVHSHSRTCADPTSVMWGKNFRESSFIPLSRLSKDMKGPKQGHVFLWSCRESGTTRALSMPG
jgi:hypothetical protein